MAEIIPFPCSESHTQLASLPEFERGAKQKLLQCLHDLRSPLSVFEVAKEKLAEESPVFAKAYERVENLFRQMEESLSQNETSNKPKVQDEKALTFQQVIRDIVQEKQWTWEKGVYWQLELEGEEQKLRSDICPHELKRVLSNLLNNAGEAQQDQGVLKVVYHSCARAHCISITDQGHGMTPHQLKKLSGQPSSTKGHTQRGLGLTHARNQLANWGGTLSVKSHWGKGSTVTLKIPKQHLKILS